MPKDKQPDTPADPFQQFEDLARKLINVPKTEVDKAEKNEKRRKKRSKSKNK